MRQNDSHRLRRPWDEILEENRAEIDYYEQLAKRYGEENEEEGDE